MNVTQMIAFEIVKIVTRQSLIDAFQNDSFTDMLVKQRGIVEVWFGANYDHDANDGIVDILKCVGQVASYKIATDEMVLEYTHWICGISASRH